MFKRILFPVDFSPRCESIADEVRAYASAAEDAEVHLVHVLELPELMAAMPEYPSYLPPDTLMVYREAAQRRLGGYLANRFQGLEVRREVLEGDAAGELAAYATRHQIDLVMIPTHGVGGFRRFLIGSTTAKILHDVPCPVWTSAHSEAAAPSAGQPSPALRNVLCCVDLAATSQAVVSYADVLAQRTGANVTLLHAVPKIGSRPANYYDVDFDAHLVQEARLKMDEFQERLGTSFQPLIVAGDPADVACQAALTQAADLILVGRAHLLEEGLERIHSHTYDVINKSPCPVLSV